MQTIILSDNDKRCMRLLARALSTAGYKRTAGRIEQAALKTELPLREYDLIMRRYRSWLVFGSEDCSTEESAPKVFIDGRVSNIKTFGDLAEYLHLGKEGERHSIELSDGGAIVIKRIP